MAELDARHDRLLLNEGIAVASVRDLQFIDTQGVWYHNVCLVSGCLSLLLKEHSVIRVQSDELKLNVLTLEWLNGTVWALFLNINFNDYIILDSVVFWVDTCPSISSLFVLYRSGCFLPYDVSFERA